jgi:SAM-dependent methyltransferase
MRKQKSLDQAYFRGLYEQDPDPWGFATSPYEEAKYAHTIEVLGEERAARGFELGCSIGVLTRRLARACDHLVSTELSPEALSEARRRCADQDNIDFRLARSVADGLDEDFDLIVLSEVVYYWDDQDLDTVAAAIARSLRPRGRLLLVHWLGETDYPKSADDAVDALAERLNRPGRLVGLVAERQDRRDGYRLDLWRRLS